MFKKFLALIVLGLLAYAAWYGARWKEQRGDLHATVIFKSAGALKKGSPVVEGSLAIGRVTKVSHLEGQDAVSIRVDKPSRARILSDSLFSVEGDGRSAQLVVVNGVAVGAPVQDGSVLYAREDRVARWLAKRSDALAPLVKQINEKASEFARNHELDQFDNQLKDWTAKVPQWSKQGEDAMNRNLAAIRQKSNELEKRLRNEKRDAEADRLHEKIDAWLAEVTSKKDPAPKTDSGAR